MSRDRAPAAPRPAHTRSFRTTSWHCYRVRIGLSTTSARAMSLLIALALALFGALLAGHGAGSASHDEHTLSAALTIDTHSSIQAPTPSSHHAGSAALTANPGEVPPTDTCSTCLTEGQMHVLTVCGLLIMSAVTLLLMPRWRESIHRAAEAIGLLVAQPAVAAVGATTPNLLSLGISRR